MLSFPWVSRGGPFAEEGEEVGEYRGLPFPGYFLENFIIQVEFFKLSESVNFDINLDLFCLEFLTSENLKSFCLNLF